MRYSIRLADTFKMACFLFRILLMSISSLFAFLVFIQSLEAAEWYIPDDLQVRTFYGRTEWTSTGPDPEDDYTWVNISLGAGWRLFSWMDLIASLGPGYLDADNHGSTASAELRLLGHVHYKFFYLDLGGGFAYLFDRDNLPELADSELYGLISGGLGIEIFRLDESYHSLYCKAGYRIEHISSPFHDSDDGDSGFNIGAIELTLGWDF